MKLSWLTSSKRMSSGKKWHASAITWWQYTLSRLVLMIDNVPAAESLVHVWQALKFARFLAGTWLLKIASFFTAQPHGGASVSWTNSLLMIYSAACKSGWSQVDSGQGMLEPSAAEPVSFGASLTVQQKAAPGPPIPLCTSSILKYDHMLLRVLNPRSPVLGCPSMFVNFWGRLAHSYLSPLVACHLTRPKYTI